MRVIITGPTGAIGMALIQKCIRSKVHVIAICHKNSKRNQNILSLSGCGEYVQLVEADLQKLLEIEQEISGNADVFYHLAWMGTTGIARNDMYLQNQNVKSTLDAVQLAKRVGCRVFIGAGSQAEYGRIEGKLCADTPTFPENGYGMAKLCAGQMSRALCEELGIKHIWVRVLSVYGPYDNENSMITGTINKLLKGEHAGFTKGEQLWDYLYSGDAAEALYALAREGRAGKVYVLGSGAARPLKDYIDIIYDTVREKGKITGSIGIGEVPYADKQVMHLEADIEELIHDTGFRPRVSFGDGICKTVKRIKSELTV
jgi:Nucleoside-diphosphate-sugar epimerases